MIVGLLSGAARVPRVRASRVIGLLAVVVLIVFGGAAMVHAQQTTSAPAESDSGENGDGDTAGTATVLSPITVYGARTTQTLDDVTSSVGIVSDDDIKQRELRNFRDSFRVLGNVRDSDFNDAGFVIRGINSEGLTPGGAPLASFYIDGIQQTVQGTRRGARGLWDVEQVEVYRGPQSTLAGRAALAGAIYVKTKDPSFDFETAARGTVGTDMKREGAAMVNLPLLEDQLALRVAAEYQRSESDLNYPTYRQFDRFDELIEDEFYSVRGKVLLEPNALPDTRGLLTYSYSEDSPDVRDIGGPALGFDFDDERGDFNTPNFAEVRRTEVHNTGLNITHDIAASLTLTSETGYSRSDTDRPSVNAGTAGETDIVTGDFIQDLFTQEFRLNYFGARLDATLGVYGAYEEEDAGFRRPNFFGFATDISRTDQETWNVAGFGEATYEFFPSWKVVVGGRVDHTDQEGSSFFSRNGAAVTDFSFSIDETVFLPKAGLIKEFGPDHTVGFVVQRGFRAGGAGIQRSTGTVFDFDSEFAWNYELSYKGRLLEGRLNLSANAFYLDLKDQQVETLEDPLDPASSRITNAAESRSFGFEVEAQAAVTEQLSGFLSVGFVETEFEDFELAGVGDLSGNAFPEAPRWNVAAGTFYRHPLGLFFGVDAEYTDDFRARIGQPPQDTLDDFFLANAQVGFEYGSLRAALFVENLFDKEYFVFEDNDIASTLGNGRLIGFSLEASF
ncbi:MAG: TonB-dependent receptor [Minwuiales bacterium]|nr:TonB-dependent receptor [Minwuiales bacterium]